MHWPPAAVRPAPRLILDDVVDAENARRHDPGKLATALMHALEAETANRRRTVGRTA